MVEAMEDKGCVCFVGGGDRVAVCTSDSVGDGFELQRWRYFLCLPLLFSSYGSCAFGLFLEEDLSGKGAKPGLPFAGLDAGTGFGGHGRGIVKLCNGGVTVVMAEEVVMALVVALSWELISFSQKSLVF